MTKFQHVMRSGKNFKSNLMRKIFKSDIPRVLDYDKEIEGFCYRVPHFYLISDKIEGRYLYLLTVAQETRNSDFYRKNCEISSSINKSFFL